jgi:hypothetical protein
LAKRVLRASGSGASLAKEVKRAGPSSTVRYGEGPRAQLPEARVVSV